jgi:hypothetical protein
MTHDEQREHGRYLKISYQIRMSEMLLTIDKTHLKELRIAYDELKPVTDL